MVPGESPRTGLVGSLMKQRYLREPGSPLSRGPRSCSCSLTLPGPGTLSHMARIREHDSQREVLGLTLVAEADNFVLQNGTPTILSYTLPNDGRLHGVLVVASCVPTASMTGGACTFSFTDGASGNVTGPLTAFAGGFGVGSLPGTSSGQLLSGGSTITIAQSSALTVGAGTLRVRIYID